MTRIHLIGAGGTGISAIARVLVEMGHTVSGSDRLASPFTRELQSAGVTIHIGHQAANVEGAELVVRSSAVPDDNPEVKAALAKGIPVLKRADFLGSLMEGRTGIAVAGTHGKTTTTAMIAWMLTALGQDPTFICGGILKNLGVNARSGKGAAFVIEADEYDRMFLGLKPAIAVVTVVEHDHPDCYPTPADFEAAFAQFVARISADGTLLYCADDPGACRVAEHARALRRSTFAYGLASLTAGALASDLQPRALSGFTFTARVRGQNLPCSLLVPGRHNVLNALAALGVASLLDLDLHQAAQALSEFNGAGRRFEVRGEAGGVTIIDDYAHHPTEIRATLAAARSAYPGRRIWAVWQPHTYSRTLALFDDFTLAFTDADAVLVTEIYRARETTQAFSSASLVRSMDHPDVQYSADLDEVTRTLSSRLSPGDVVLVLSAGDADTVSTNLLAQLKEA